LSEPGRGEHRPGELARALEQAPAQQRRQVARICVVERPQAVDGQLAFADGLTADELGQLGDAAGRRYQTTP
jgi:hypothetical protein